MFSKVIRIINSTINPYLILFCDIIICSENHWTKFLIEIFEETYSYGQVIRIYMRMYQYVPVYLNFPLFNLKSNTVLGNSYPSIGYCKILSKLCHSSPVWLLLERKALLLAEITIFRNKVEPMGIRWHNFIGKKPVYWISSWSHRHDWRRTFWMPNWGRYIRNLRILYQLNN